MVQVCVSTYFGVYHMPGETSRFVISHCFQQHPSLESYGGNVRAITDSILRLKVTTPNYC